MKNEKLLHAIGQIDDDMIEDAIIQPGQKKQPFVRTPAFRRVVAIAACFVLVIGLALSMPKWFNPNSDGPGVPIDPGKLPPPSVEGDGSIHIGGIDELAYYAAVRMIAGTPKTANQSVTGGSYGIALLASGYDTDKREEPPEPETTGPDETQGPPVSTTPTPPAGYDEDIYYYALDPNEPFFIDKVSMFQILLTDENGFLASQLGLGIVDVVITENCIWGESLLTFRNGEKFYSCLTNGWGYDRETGGTQWDFSTHKYVEGFYIVKNLEQENYKFYIEMNAAGDAVTFTCSRGIDNGGDRPDQNVQIVSSTEISNEGRSFTVAELEEYFNTGKLPEDTLLPPKPTTNLEFWIAENVDDVDFSKFQEKYGMFGGTEYYGTGYVPTINEQGQQVDPEHCVIYTVTSYPDYSDKEQHITRIYITDPSVEFYGITLRSSIQDVIELLQQQSFEITESGDEWVEARSGSVWITFTKEWIQIRVEVTNETGMQF